MIKIKLFFICQTILSVVLLMAWPAQASVQLPAIISNHMVIQANRPVKIWGWADPGQQITVALAGQTKTATTAPDGAWRVTLAPVQSNQTLSMTIKGKNTIHITDILVGQVWLCSGQSNMEFPLHRTTGGKQAAAKATNPQIRLFHMPRHLAAQTMPHSLISHPAPPYRMWGFNMKGGTGKWVVCNPKDADRFSGVGFYFGKDLHSALKQPVGLIESAWGGTPIQSWISKKALAQSPHHDYFQSYFSRIARRLDERRRTYPQKLARWKKQAAIARAEHQKPPRRPRKPRAEGHNPNVPSVLFNGMIHPLIPFSIRGTVWYQGASNAGSAYGYRMLLPALIEDWRSRWGLGELPFCIVQLPNYGRKQTSPVQRAYWAVLRESQLKTAERMPDVGLTVNIDLGQAKILHPRDKADVGHRLALWALAKVYGKDVVYSGPIYSGMTIAGDKVHLTFKHVDGGLVAKGHGGKLMGFAIAGADKKFYWATTKIAGNKVTLHSSAVTHPVAVRYAWASNPICNLYNKAGLPASPFRTDQWRVRTQTG